MLRNNHNLYNNVEVVVLVIDRWQMIDLVENSHVDCTHVQVQKRNLSNDLVHLFLFDANLMEMYVIDIDKLLCLLEAVAFEME